MPEQTLLVSRRRPRRFVWLAALAATAVWPAVAQMRAGADPRGDGARRSAVSPALGVQRLSAFVVPAVGGEAARGLTVTLLTAWGLLSTALVLRLIAGLHVLRRCRRRWPVAEIDGVRVRVSADAGPAVVGLLPMDVVLPNWTLALDRPLRTLVLRHEEEHRAARDPYLLLFATILTALAPWHPALWWQARRLRLAVEVDCDARVLRAHPRRDRYALLLLAIAQRRGAGAPRLAPALSEPTSHLDRRITAMRTPAHPMSRPRTLAFGIATTAAVAVACSVEPPERATAPTAPPAAQPSVAPTPSAPPGAFFEFQVQQPADKLSGPAPRYPAVLRDAKVGGQVIAQFVVNPDGSADMSTFKALKSDHALFTTAVASVLPEWRFTPAEADGRKVKQLVQLPFMFALKR